MIKHIKGVPFQVQLEDFESVGRYEVEVIVTHPDDEVTRDVVTLNVVEPAQISKPPKTKAKKGEPDGPQA